MYFFNIKKLAREIISGNLSEKEKINYYIATYVIAVLITYFSLLMPEPEAMMDVSFGIFEFLLQLVLLAPIIFFSIKKISSLNDEIDGKFLIERIVVLTLPAMIWGMAISLLIMVTISFVMGMLLSEYAIFVYYIPLLNIIAPSVYTFSLFSVIIYALINLINKNGTLIGPSNIF